MTAPTRRRNGPVEAQPALPWAAPLPRVEAPATTPKASPREPARWTAYTPTGDGWGVAVRSVADGEITIDREGGAYLIRRWTRTPGSAALRHDPETLRRAPSFEAAVALTLEMSPC